jgi:Taurine catabolism dioxygenase TauD, TfdA family
MNIQVAPRSSSRAPRGVPMLEQDVVSTLAWTGETIKERDWLLSIPSEVVKEVRAMLVKMRDDPLPVLLQEPSLYQLNDSKAFFTHIKDILDNGVGFVLLDRIPIEEMTEDEAKAVYWVLSKLFGRPVAQKWNGAMMMDVRDTGKKPTPGSGVRLSQTNVDLAYHSDNAHNDAPAEYVGLLALRGAKEGGLSRIMSFYTVHNYLRKNHPEKLKRLYKPFFWDRMREHRPEDSELYNAPIFSFDGSVLNARLGVHQIRNAYALVDGGMDKETEEALAALDEAFSQEKDAVMMMMQPGQIQFLNNKTIGHSRTEFDDYDEPERKRLLVRMWLRNQGTQNYRGAI